MKALGRSVGLISCVVTGVAVLATAQVRRVGPLNAPPSVIAITPAHSPIAGGTEIVVAGSGFLGATVSVDDRPVTPTTQSDTEIRLRTPQHDNGYAVVSVSSAAGTAYGEFLYVAPRLQDLPAGSITTVAGIGTYVRDFGPATSATFAPAGLALAPDGALYVAQPLYGQIVRIRTEGIVERVTASGGGPSNGDGGPSQQAHIVFPLAVAADPAGNVYIPDQNRFIRRVDAQTGVITTIAGTGALQYSGDDGPAIRAGIAWPTHIAADAEDVFFIDFGASRVRRIHLGDGTISTYVGTGTAGFSGDGGPAAAAQFNVGDADKGHLALDPAGNLYIADTANYRIRRIDRRSGVISTFYTFPPGTIARDGVGEVRSLAFDRAGNAYYGGSGRIVKVGPAGQFVTSWGTGGYALPIEGAAAATTGLGHITGLAIASNGDILYSDDAIFRIRRIDVASGKVFTVGGIGPSIVGENGPALASYLYPWDIAFDRDGNLLVADETLRVRRIDRDGNISTIGGTGSFVGQQPPAPALAVTAGGTGIDLDRSGEIELTMLSVIMHIDPAGFIREIAGHGAVCGYSGDGGLATAAAFCQAWDSIRDPDGNLIVADTNNNRIRRVAAQTGMATTIVGNGGPVNGYERYGNGTFCGDGGPALNACINTPYGVAMDSRRNLFIAEGLRIRRVDPSGTISTFATVNARATKLVVDADDNLYAGSGNSRIVRFDQTGRETTLAGQTGVTGFSGDGGPALQARLNVNGQAAGIAIDREGNLYFCDSHRIRAIRLGARISALRNH